MVTVVEEEREGECEALLHRLEDTVTVLDADRLTLPLDEAQYVTVGLLDGVWGTDVATALRVMVTLVEEEREGECEALLHRLEDTVGVLDAERLTLPLDEAQ
jgi:hypothetical protein